jgi:2-keto-4-pentenoate hydratase
MSNRFERAAEMLIDVRRTGYLLDDLPDDLAPKTSAEASELQDAIAARRGALGGWKVLAGGPGAPLPAAIYFDSGATIDASSLLIFLTEVEVAVRIGKDLPKREEPYSKEEVEAAIVAVHPALEMIASPFVDRTKVSKLVLMGDLQSNGAVVVGPALDDWRHLDFAKLPISVSYDAVEVASVATGASYDDIMHALAWLANHATTRSNGLQAGNVVITGARIALDAGTARTIKAEITGLGLVNVFLK